MKKNVLLMGFLLSFVMASAKQHRTAITDSRYATLTNRPPAKMLRHVVLFKFKQSATPSQIKEVEDAFRKLPQQISTIRAFEWGINNSPEGLSQGFTHVFLVSFDSETDRNEYLPNPAHKAFVKVLEPVLDKVLVVDYWAGS